MYEKLLKTVTNLGSPKVLVAGDFILDAYVYGDASRVSPEAPVPVLKVTKTEYSCGGAGSVAADLAAFGARVYCVGIVGKDRNGAVLRQKLTDIGADTSGLLEVEGRPTTIKQRLIGLAQHRHKQQLMRLDEESVETLTNELSREILQAYEDKLRQSDIVCLQDYNKGLLSPEICQKVIELAIEADKKVLVDPSFTADYSKYSGANILTPNRREASKSVGFEIKTTKDVAEAAKQLAEDLRLEAVIITLDKEGVYLRTEDIDEVIPTRVRDVYDVTGAGDMVLATLTVTLAAGFDYKTAVQLANITAGIEVEKFGAMPVTIKEVIDEITGKSGELHPVDFLIEELAWHRRKNEKIVFTNGCFDVIHRGHIEFLKFCKLQGDIVVVGLNSDSSVKTIKGPERPINNQYDRAAVLSALGTVDYITLFDEPTPIELIKKVKPDVLVKGEDWAQKGVVGREFVESYGGKVVLASLVKGKSSTATIEKMKSLGKNQVIDRKTGQHLPTVN